MPKYIIKTTTASVVSKPKYYAVRALTAGRARKKFLASLPKGEKTVFIEDIMKMSRR